MNRENMIIEPEKLLQKLGDVNIRIYDAAVSDGQYLQGHILVMAFFDHEKFSNSNGKYVYTILPEGEFATLIGDIGIYNDTKVKKDSAWICFQEVREQQEVIRRLYS